MKLFSSEGGRKLAHMGAGGEGLGAGDFDVILGLRAGLPRPVLWCVNPAAEDRPPVVLPAVVVSGALRRPGPVHPVGSW
jgi:hypothetical protein